MRRTAFVTLLISLLSPSVDAQTSPLAFVNVNVVPMDQERILTRHTVVVRDGRIIAIGPTEKISIPRGARRIDASGKYLMPGLADMHVHVREAWELPLFIASGVTTIRHMGGLPRRIELKGTEGPIYALAWAPNGSTLASTGHRQVNLWRLGDNAPLRTFRGHTGLVFGVAWSPDGASIASAGEDGIAHVWNAETLLETAMLQTGPSRAVKWSHGGRLAIGSGVRMQIWQATSREVLYTAKVQTQISSVSWSPDDKTVAVGGVNGMTTLWNAQTGALVAKMNASDQGRNDVNGVTWSPHGRILATAHGARGRGEIRLWNPAAERLVQTLASPGGWLRGISWSPDGQWLAAGGEDGQVRIWNAESGEVVATLPTDSQPVWSVAWSPDGRLLAAGNTGTRVTGGTVSIWETPVRVLMADGVSNRARAVETTLLKRGTDAPATAPKAPRVATVFTDGGASGTVIRVEPPFGNIETSFVESDFRSLGIASGDTFHAAAQRVTGSFSSVDPMTPPNTACTGRRAERTFARRR